MSLEEARAIIGGPGGFYDGVHSFNANALGYKGYRPWWVGTQGYIELTLDADERVETATYYPVESMDQHLTQFAWERLTRGFFRGVHVDPIYASLAYGSFIILLAAATLLLAVAIARRSRTINHFLGLLLVVGSWVTVILLYLERHAVLDYADSSPTSFQLGAGTTSIFLMSLIVLWARRHRQIYLKTRGEQSSL